MRVEELANRYNLEEKRLVVNTKSTQAQLASQQARISQLQELESDRMSQQAAAATVRAQYQEAKLQSDTDEALAKDGLIPALNLKLSRYRHLTLATN